LAHVLGRLQPNHDPRILIDASTGDDAAVWRIDADRALVLTADFITPLVDDARTWGRIAACNAVSDVYAMGGRPVIALNLVGWNRAELPIELLGDVLEGAAETAAEAGFFLVGGHTVDDPEPKFGLAVVGEVHPDRLITNAGLRPGQSILLSKPLGIGVISTALKAGSAPAATVAAGIEQMTRLNDDAARVALAGGATGGTDVTGFGLIGHLGRSAKESGVDIELDVDSVPVIAGVRELAEQGFIPGGSRRNLDSLASQVDRGGLDDLSVLLLADAQTSGGLVFGVDPDRAAESLAALIEAGHTAAIIGSTRAPDAEAAPGVLHLRR
jgi:selenide,water dikinase